MKTLGVDAPARQRVFAAARRRLGDAAAANTAAGRTPPSVELQHGSIGTLELSAPYDVIALIEVVEHREAPELELLGDSLLARAAPRKLLVTTPNKEYNLNWVTAPTAATPGGDLDPPPPLESLELRNSDHKFEWTRAEFREWADAPGARHGYTVPYHGVGGGPPDEPTTAARTGLPGPGPITQAAALERP